MTLAKFKQERHFLEISPKNSLLFSQHYNLFATKLLWKIFLEGLIVARKVPKEEALKRAESALEKVGLLAYKDYYPFPSYLEGNNNE